MTELRYLPDSDDITTFTATVEKATDEYIVLNGTYFYPEGGGQPADFSDEDVTVIEERTNVALEQDLPVEKKQMARDEAEKQTPEGRGLLDLIPDHVDPLRMVKIGDLDLCPCGGTHVDRLSDVGRVRITNRTSKGADVDRIKFGLVD